MKDSERNGARRFVTILSRLLDSTEPIESSTKPINGIGNMTVSWNFVAYSRGKTRAVFPPEDYHSRFVNGKLRARYSFLQLWRIRFPRHGKTNASESSDTSDSGRSTKSRQRSLSPSRSHLRLRFVRHETSSRCDSKASIGLERVNNRKMHAERTVIDRSITGCTRL